MIMTIIKAICIILIIHLVMGIGGLYRVWERMPDSAKDKGWVAFGILAEVVMLILLSIKIIT